MLLVHVDVPLLDAKWEKDAGLIRTRFRVVRG